MNASSAVRMSQLYKSTSQVVTWPTELHPKLPKSFSFKLQPHYVHREIIMAKIWEQVLDFHSDHI